ncbi:hypothetical protein ElyMa_000203700 [Elysia marginata]|uniref:Uncharacterized protein n=1 Tax=Elysia marginata TaxID=1093978 RepID=A0AAV4EXI1_9GAST|nr:hypothetical protein ElyMa_000203700 [Elysia marginata]
MESFLTNLTTSGSRAQRQENVSVENQSSSSQTDPYPLNQPLAAAIFIAVCVSIALLCIGEKTDMQHKFHQADNVRMPERSRPPAAS